MRAPESSNATFALERLRRFGARAPDVERCDLCGQELSPAHEHLIDPETRTLRCACTACAVLFSGSSSMHLKRVSRRTQLLADFCLTDSQWDSLRLPINLAFFFRSSVQQRVIACYPSPAGAMESLLDLDTWEDIERENPSLALEPDVEALLVNRTAQAHATGGPFYLVVPIDQCYKLIGVIRTKWSGLSGGTEVWKEIARFFEELAQQGAPRAAERHA